MNNIKLILCRDQQETPIVSSENNSIIRICFYSFGVAYAFFSFFPYFFN